MKAVYIEVGQDPKVIDIEDKLEVLQEAVGGYIECVSAFDDPSVCYIVNEEGKLDNLPWNVPLVYNGKIVDVLAGNVLVVGDDGEGSFCSLIEAQIQKYKTRDVWFKGANLVDVYKFYDVCLSQKLQREED